MKLLIHRVKKLSIVQQGLITGLLKNQKNKKIKRKRKRQKKRKEKKRKEIDIQEYTSIFILYIKMEALSFDYALFPLCHVGSYH